MTDHELDILDRRAAAAVADLDRALPDGAEWVPAHSPPPPDRSVRPLLLAAAVAIVAVLGLGLVMSRLGEGDDQSTVAGEGDVGGTDEFVRLTFLDPAADALAFTAAFDGISAATDQEQVTATIQGPNNADDPWTGAVQVFTTTSEGSELYGELVDLGGVNGSFVRAPIFGLQWIDDGRRHSLTSAALDETALAALATEAIASGWRGDGPLPGHRILHTGGLGETFPTLPYVSLGVDQAVAAVGYRSDDLAFAVGTVPGGESRYRALQVFGDTEAVQVRGREGVIVRHPGVGDLVTIAWRENDRTVAQVETFDDPGRVIDHLDALEPTETASFDELLEMRQVDDEHRLLEIPADELDRFSDPDETPPDEVMAEISETRQGFGARALLFRNEGQPPSLHFVTEDSSGGASGTGAPVRDLEHATVARSSDGTRGIFAGVVPDAVGSIEVEGADPARIEDIEQVSIGGSDAVLFVAWSEAAAPLSSTVVRITLADGRVIRYAT